MKRINIPALVFAIALPAVIVLFMVQNLIASDIWIPSLETSWQWQLDGTVDQSYDVDMYDIDMFDNDAECRCLAA